MIQTLIGLILVTMGVFVACVAVLGTYRFHYVLNRMHATALCDTLGLLLVLAGLIVLLGVSWHSAKLAVIIVFMWLASPVMSHLTGRAEILTHTHIEDECEEIPYERRV